MIIKRYRIKDFSVYPTGSMGAVSYNGQHNISFSEGSQFRRIDRRSETVFLKPSRPKPFHPWFTVANWYDEIAVSGAGGSGGAGAGSRGGSASETKARAKGYSAMVYPGFVNGLDPIVYGAPEITLDAEPPPSPKGTYLFGEKVKPSDAKKRVPGLLEAPLIPLSFLPYRKKNTQVANFFQKKYNFDPLVMRGASDIAAEASAQAAAGRNPVLDITDPGKAPWLGFCDLYLANARQRYDLSVSTSGFPVQGIDYDFTYDTSALSIYGQRSRLLTGERPEMQDPKAQGVAALTGASVEDVGQDFITVSTVFILKDGDWGGDPDAVKLDGKNEKIFVQHSCFWNLEYRPRNQMISDLPDVNVAQSFAPLVGRYTLAPVALAAVSEGILEQAITSLINENGAGGKYWT